MENIHMGQLLERVVKRKGLKVSELATALGITRRTLYNWFKQEVIDEVTMAKISSVIVYDFSSNPLKPTITTKVSEEPPKESQVEKDETYWKNRYIDLLERYSGLLAETLKK
jgi:transcriptional regulator with XRE-family HTH domain